MVTTPTPSNGLALQGTGDNVGTWGATLNDQDFTLTDQSLDGLTSVTVSGTITLSSTDYVPNEARRRVLKTGGTGGTVIIPGKTKWYLVHNACSGALTVKTSADPGVTLPSGTITPVYCDGTACFVATNVWPLADGSALSPSGYFSADSDTGIYRIAANRFGIAAGGTLIVEVNTTQVAIQGALNVNGAGAFVGAVSNANGTALLPSVTFSTDPDTGIYNIAANRLGLSAGGVLIAEVNTAGMSVTGALSSSGTVTSNGLSVTGTIASTGASSSSTKLVGNGTNLLPSVSFSGDTDTGIYNIAANRLGISAGGVATVEVNATTLVVNGIVSATGNGSYGGTLTVTGACSFLGGASVTGSASTTLDIGSGRDLSVTRNCVIGGTLNVGLLGTFAGANFGSDVAVTGNLSATVDIGSSRDLFATRNAVIGGSCTAFSYVTSSDYRLKTDIEDLSNSGQLIDSLRPRRFTWTASGKRDAGFIAHEVPPSLAVGEKDAVNEDGQPIYQGVQYSAPELIASLVAEVQALRARVALLEAFRG